MLVIREGESATMSIDRDIEKNQSQEVTCEAFQRKIREPLGVLEEGKSLLEEDGDEEDLEDNDNSSVLDTSERQQQHTYHDDGSRDLPPPSHEEYPSRDWEHFYDVLPGCHGQFNHIELVMPCQEPLSFLPFFGRRHHEDRSNDEAQQEVIAPPGVYTLPKSCEYCGEDSTENCSDNCDRPKLFFRRKRPPFCRPGKDWEPVTDYHIPQKKERAFQDRVVPSSSIEEVSAKAPKRKSRWMPGLFG